VTLKTLRNMLLLVTLVGLCAFGQCWTPNSNPSIGLQYHATAADDSNYGPSELTGTTPIYVIYRGTVSSDIQSMNNYLMTYLSGTKWWSILERFCDSLGGTPSSIYLAGTVSVPLSSYSNTDYPGSLVNSVISYAIGNNLVPLVQNAIYVDFDGYDVPESATSWHSINGCADHVSASFYNGTNNVIITGIQIPYLIGCSTARQYSGLGVYPDSQMTFLTHEIAESVADQYYYLDSLGFNGWDANGSTRSEVADLCASAQFLGNTYDGSTYVSNITVGPSNLPFYFNLIAYPSPRNVNALCKLTANEPQVPLTVVRPSSGQLIWYRQFPGNEPGVNGIYWGLAGDIPLNFNNQLLTSAPDLAVWRPSNATWYIYGLKGPSLTKQFGLSGDTPMTADFDRDGRSDLVVYRPGPNGSQSYFFISHSRTGYTDTQMIPWGLGGDTPLIADFDGDGCPDLAVTRPSGTSLMWYVTTCASGFVNTPWMTFAIGSTSDVKQFAEDMDGDGKADPISVSVSSGLFQWNYLSSSSSYSYTSGTLFGDASTDIPVMSYWDWYSRDPNHYYYGWTPVASPGVFNQPSGYWLTSAFSESTSLTSPAYYSTQFGLSGDIPITWNMK
jgi:FG-GAP-like repeat